MDKTKVTAFTLNPRDLEKWMHQNRAVYVGDFVEGCLLDNFVLACKNGFAAVYEKYVNPNMSTYYVEFQRGAAQRVFCNWYDFEERANA